MKKYLGAILGAIFAAIVVYAIAWLAGHFFGPLYNGEDEATRNFKIFLFIFVASVIGGGIIGFRISGQK